MVKGLYTAYTGMIIQQKRMDTLTHNMANSDTDGYKKEGMTVTSFAEQLAHRIKDTTWNGGLHQGIGDITFGAKVGETYTDWTIGGFRVTDEQTDFAIEGQGFFAISYTNKAGETSIKYTRDGNFVIDTQGYLRTKDGDYVLNNADALAGNTGGRIQVDPTMDIHVDELANIWQNNQVVGNIGVIDIADYDYLREYGENFYDLAEGGQVVENNTSLLQGTLEKSNTNVVTEMVDLIVVSRAYEANQKLITAIDGDLDKAVNQVGKI